MNKALSYSIYFLLKHLTLSNQQKSKNEEFKITHYLTDPKQKINAKSKFLESNEVLINK